MDKILIINFTLNMLISYLHSTDGHTQIDASKSIHLIGSNTVWICGIDHFDCCSVLRHDGFDAKIKKKWHTKFTTNSNHQM